MHTLGAVRAYLGHSDRPGGGEILHSVMNVEPALVTERGQIPRRTEESEQSLLPMFTKQSD
jgi:hypothetical protein